MVLCIDGVESFLILSFLFYLNFLKQLTDNANSLFLMVCAQFLVPVQ